MFVACTTLAGAGWAMLLLYPGKPRVQSIAGVTIPCALAAADVGALGWHARELSGGFTSLGAVAQLFSHPWALLAGWIHFLAFDLFLLVAGFPHRPADLATGGMLGLTASLLSGLSDPADGRAPLTDLG